MQPSEYPRTQSSLLIPEKFLADYLLKTKRISREGYFHLVLWKYRGLLLDGILPRPNKIKKAYQEEGQNLKKLNFLPSNSDWVELGILSNWLGISRTALFTWLLMMDLSDFDPILREKFYESGVPSTFTTMLLKNLLTRRKTIIWRRKIYYKTRE